MVQTMLTATTAKPKPTIRFREMIFCNILNNIIMQAMPK